MAKQINTQNPVQTVRIIIEWKKSRTWGLNPHCTADIRFKDGTFERSPIYKASGCGYCKESTVIANVFNAYLKYKLKGKRMKSENIPYGIVTTQDRLCYEGGVGTSCYYKISQFIGGTFENVASAKNFDVFQYVDGKR